MLYASRHGCNDSVKCLLHQRIGVNDGSLHEAARGLHAEIVELLVQAGHDPNFASEMHGGRTALGELCLLADGRGAESALDCTLRALASGGADPLRRSGSPLPIFLALANRDPRPVVEKLTELLMHQQLARPEVIFECDQLAYSPTTYLKKLVLPSAGHAMRASRIPSAEHQQRSVAYPADSSLEVYDTPAVSRAFHLSVATVYNELLNLFIRNGARDRFYYTGTDAAQPVDMVGAPEHIARAEDARRQQLEGLRRDPHLAHRQIPQPRPARGWDNDDELHTWAGEAQEATTSGVQRRLAEETREVAGRRALSELVNRHTGQQNELTRDAERLRREALNKLQLDRLALQTEWSAKRADAREGIADPKHREAAQQLVVARDARLAEHERAREASFVDEDERRLAKRPGAALRDTALRRRGTPGPENLSAAVAELSIGEGGF